MPKKRMMVPPRNHRDNITDVKPDSTISGFINFWIKRYRPYSKEPSQMMRPVEKINESGATLKEEKESAT